MNTKGIKDWMHDLVAPEERTGEDGKPLARDTLLTRIATAVFAALAVGMFAALVIYNVSRGTY